MYTIDFKNPVHIHFIGIGGISMSGIAHILLKNGFTVSGSDRAESALTDKLVEEGCKVIYSQTAANISTDIDLVVYTAAVKPSNPELARAIELGIPTLTRAELLGQLMKNYKVAINVAGTHGKTTTTSMISEILIEGQCDPTISVGGILESIGGNVRIGKSDIFVAEACEYTNSFLSFNPTINVILNVKADHLDFFKDLDDIRHSFKLFCERLPEGGTLVINTDIENYEYFYQDKDLDIIKVGSNPSECDYAADNISYDDFGACSYDLYEKGEKVGRVSLSVPGIHNVSNSLASIAVARKLGLDLDVIIDGLKNYHGTDRRFQKKGMYGKLTVIDDYAHHPDEISATLESAKHYPHERIICAFQPHTYTRTKALMGDFAKSLSAADIVILADIYAAREKDTLGISSETLMNEVKKFNPNCYYFDSFEKIEEFVKNNYIDNDLLITMGAGDIYKVGESLVNSAKQS